MINQQIKYTSIWTHRLREVGPIKVPPQANRHFSTLTDFFDKTMAILQFDENTVKKVPNPTESDQIRPNPTESD